jgi:hypothetical protein
LCFALSSQNMLFSALGEHFATSRPTTASSALPSPPACHAMHLLTVILFCFFAPFAPARHRTASCCFIWPYQLLSTTGHSPTTLLTLRTGRGSNPDLATTQTTITYNFPAANSCVTLCPYFIDTPITIPIKSLVGRDPQSSIADFVAAASFASVSTPAELPPSSLVFVHPRGVLLGRDGSGKERGRL